MLFVLFFLCCKKSLRFPYPSLPILLHISKWLECFHFYLHFNLYSFLHVYFIYHFFLQREDLHLETLMVTQPEDWKYVDIQTERTVHSYDRKPSLTKAALQTSEPKDIVMDQYSVPRRQCKTCWEKMFHPAKKFNFNVYKILFNCAFLRSYNSLTCYLPLFT